MTVRYVSRLSGENTRNMMEHWWSKGNRIAEFEIVIVKKGWVDWETILGRQYGM